MVVRAAIGLLSMLGFVISASFALEYHRVARFFKRIIPRFCRMESTSCSTLLATPESRLFGVPNFDLGLLYYCSLAISAILPEIWFQLRTMFLFGAIITAAAGFYLSYVLVFRLHIRCTLCTTCHAINLLIFVLLLIGR